MLKKVCAFLVTVTVLAMSFTGVYASEIEWNQANLIDGINLIYDGTFDTVDTAHFKFENAAGGDGVSDTGDTAYGNAAKVTSGKYFYESKFLPDMNNTCLAEFIKRGAKIRFDFEIKPTTTLTDIRVQLRSGDTKYSDIGTSYAVTGKCFVDDTVLGAITTGGKYSGLSLAENEWHKFSVYFDFSAAHITLDTSKYLWAFILPTCANGVAYIDNIKLYATDISPEPFTKPVTLAEGVTAATSGEITALGTLPENIGMIYKYTATPTEASANFDLVTIDKEVWGLGNYIAQIDFYEPNRTDGITAAVTRGFRTYTTVSGAKSIDLIGYPGGGLTYTRNEWHSVSKEFTVAEDSLAENLSYRPILSTKYGLKFKWNTLDNLQGFETLGINGTSHTIFFSIKVYRNCADNVLTNTITTKKFSSANIFDFSAYLGTLAETGAVVADNGWAKVSSASNITDRSKDGGTIQPYFTKTFGELFTEGAIVKVTFKAKGDGVTTYDADAGLQLRTGSSKEFPIVIPKEDLNDGQEHTYTIYADMNDYEETYLKVGTETVVNRTTAQWWLRMVMADSGTQTPNANIWFGDFDVRSAENSESTPDITVGTFSFVNNSREVVGLGEGSRIIIASYDNNTLVDVKIKDFEKEVAPQKSKIINVFINGYNPSYTYKVFALESMDTLVPYTAYAEK